MRIALLAREVVSALAPPITSVRLEKAVKSIRLVLVTYFTAEPDGNGGIRYFPDIYKRGKRATTSDGSERCTQ